MTLIAARAARPRAIDPRAAWDSPAPVAPLNARARGYDRTLLVCALALSLVGALLVWAATRDQLRGAGGNPQQFLLRHLFNLAIAATLCLITSRLDVRLLRLFGPIVYLGSIGGLLLVFAVGSTINGAHAWIRIGGGFELQPSEFMKLGLIVGMAVLFAGREARRTEAGIQFAPPPGMDVALAVGMIAIPLALVVKQPDLGSAMVLSVASFGVLVAADVRARYIFGLAAVAVGGVVIAIQAGMLHHYQLQRFSVFANPGKDPQGAAYNIIQAHIAIANGGLFGTGLFHGPQTDGGFVPEQQTDFVFSVAGEEFGLIGGAVIIVLFAVLCWRGLRIARDADRSGRLIAVGIVCWLAFQAFQNIGMNLGLMPVTGLPLPFVSYGGSSMFAQGLAVGLLEAINRRTARW